jgi:hypothetical protein
LKYLFLIASLPFKTAASRVSLHFAVLVEAATLSIATAFKPG